MCGVGRMLKRAGVTPVVPERSKRRRLGNKERNWVSVDEENA